MKRAITISLAFAAALAALPVAGATAAEGGPRATLERAESLFADGRAAKVGDREPTLILRDLALVLDDLSAPQQERARAILERPTSARNEDFFGPEDPRSPFCTKHFCVHWAAGVDEKFAQHAPAPEDTAPANGIPDFVDRVGEAAEASHAVQHGELGWRSPVPDGPLGGSSLTDIYLVDLEGEFFGYAASDPGQSGRSRSGYLVIDNDYAAGYQGVPLDLMRVTIAHEYNHILHFAYDTFQDSWLFEATATWVEDRVFPAIDDYLNFVPAFATRPHKPLAEPEDRLVKLYGSAMWNHWLDARLGPGVIRGAWERSRGVNPSGFAVAAFDAAIGAAGGGDLARQFVGFATASAVWNSTGVFPDEGRYPEVRRSGRLGRRTKRTRLDHTAYRLYKVAGGRDVKLVVKAPRRTRAGLGLVGLDPDGTVISKTRYLRRGGRGAVRLAGSSGLSRVTAVVVNADGRVKGGGRSYIRDKQPFRIKLKRRGARR